MLHKLILLLCLTLMIAACTNAKPDPTPPATVTPVAGPEHVGVAEPTSEPQALPPTPPAPLYSITIDYDHVGAGTASIEERAYAADIVVIARLLSAGNDELRFQAIEYLKGTGGNTFTVSAETDGRDTQWDNQDAVLFLKTPGSSTGSSAARTASGHKTFADTTDAAFLSTSPGARAGYKGSLPEGHTIDSRNPVWIPLGTGSGARSATDSGATGTRTTIDRETLREKVRWTTGGGSAVSADYDMCIRRGLSILRDDRDIEAYYGSPWETRQVDNSIASGAGKGLPIYEPDLHEFFNGYGTQLISGPDAELFLYERYDDDEIATNGYRETIVTARPLPRGGYTIFRLTQLAVDFPCDFRLENGHMIYTVAAEAPRNVVHEAFFDPMALSAGVGFGPTATSTAGVLKPTSFSERGTTTNITGLKWENGNVVLKLDPFISLRGCVRSL